MKQHVQIESYKVVPNNDIRVSPENAGQQQVEKRTLGGLLEDLDLASFHNPIKAWREGTGREGTNVGLLGDIPPIVLDWVIQADYLCHVKFQ